MEKKSRTHRSKAGMKRIEFCLDSELEKKLLELKTTSGLHSISEVLRELINKGYVEAALTKEESTDIRVLNRMGANLWSIMTKFKAKNWDELADKYLKFYEEFVQANLYYRRRLYKKK